MSSNNSIKYPNIKTAVLNVFNAVDAFRTNICEKRDVEFKEVKANLANYFSESIKAIMNSDSANTENVSIPKTPAKKRRRSQVVLSSVNRLSLTNRNRVAKSKGNNKIVRNLLLDRADLNETNCVSGSEGSAKLRLSSESEEDEPEPKSSAQNQKQLASTSANDDEKASSERSIRRSKRSNVVDLNQSSRRLSFKVPPARKTQTKTNRLSRKRNTSSKTLSTASILESISSDGENTKATELSVTDSTLTKPAKRSKAKNSSISVSDENNASTSIIVPPPSNRASRSRSRRQNTNEDLETNEINNSKKYSLRNLPLVEEKVEPKTSKTATFDKVEAPQSLTVETKIAKKSSLKLSKMETLAETKDQESSTLKEVLAEKSIKSNEIEGTATKRLAESKESGQVEEESTDSEDLSHTSKGTNSAVAKSKGESSQLVEKSAVSKNLPPTSKRTNSTTAKSKAESTQLVEKSAVPENLPHTSKRTNSTTAKSKAESGQLDEKSAVSENLPHASKRAISATAKSKAESAQIVEKSPVMASVTSEEHQMEPSVRPKEKLAVPSETTKTNEVPTPAFGRISTSPYLPRNSLRPRVMLMKMVSPKSPRQLFSPYASQTVKNKAAIYESLQQTPANSQIKKKIPETIIIKPRNASPIIDQNTSISRKSSRKSIITPLGITENLFLAKYDRMTISQKRRSSVRLSLAAIKNQICKEAKEMRKSQGTKVEDANDADAESEYESASSGEENEPIPQKKPSAKRSKGPSVVPSKKMKTNANTKKDSLHRVSNSKPTYPGSENRQTGFSRIPSSFQSRSSNGFNSASKTMSAGRIGSVQKIASTFGSVVTPTIAPIVKKQDRWLEEELRKMKEREKLVLQNKEKLMKEKMEMHKKKNEEKQMRVLQKRQQMFKVKEERKRTIELKQEQHAQRKQELEQKRKEDLERRRKEEMAMKLKLQAIKNAQLEEERKREQERIMEELSKPIAIAGTSKSTNKVISAEKPMPKSVTGNKAVGNETFNADVSEVGVYDITPHHSELPPQKLADPEDYDINDLKSEDDTDDESAPRKQIPSWANGIKLHLLLRRQHRSNLNPDEIFPSLDICQDFDLAAVFPIHRRRFFNRTSSAVWHVPPHLEGQKH